MKVQAITIENNISFNIFQTTDFISKVVNDTKKRISKFSALGLKSIPLDKLSEKYTNPHSRFIEINGTKVHYCDQGKGPVIILIHGVLASLQTWNSWTKTLSSYYRVIRLDLPGFGLTNPLKEDLCLESLLNFFHSFIEALDLKEFILAGSSLGGYIAWNYAVIQKKRVKKLILIGSVGYSQNVPGIINFVNIPIIRYLASKITPRIFIEFNVRQIYCDKSKVSDKLVDSYFELGLNSENRKVITNIFKLMKQQCKSNNLSDNIDNIETPTLLMWGKEDPWVPVKAVERWERDLQKSKTIIYDNVGHLPMEESPYRSAKDVLTFLKTEENY